MWKIRAWNRQHWEAKATNELTKIWLHFDHNLTKMWPKCDHNLTTICPKFDQNLTKIWPKFDQNLKSSKFVWKNDQMNLKNAWYRQNKLTHIWEIENLRNWTFLKIKDRNWPKNDQKMAKIWPKFDLKSSTLGGKSDKMNWPKNGQKWPKNGQNLTKIWPQETADYIKLRTLFLVKEMNMSFIC